MSGRPTTALLLTAVGAMLFSVKALVAGSGLAAQAGVVGPVATVFLGWYFLGEVIGVLQFVGVAIVLFRMGMLLTVARASDGRLMPADETAPREPEQGRQP